ncbi:MAG TPA: hypothetical protein VF174_06145 [Micromonosporaceae bacterium]
MPLSRRAVRPRVVDTAAIAGFVVVALWVTGRLWLDPHQGLAANRMDQALFEWMLAHGARVVTDFANPFFSYRMNVPDGVNLMANTSVLAVSIPLAPVTLAFGPSLAFRVFLTGAMIATALSWYLVLSRHLVSSRPAAVVGASFAAFGPSMVSHANGHPNIVAQFVVPLIVWRVLRLRETGRWLRNGLILGLLIVWQAFINLEILLMTAVGLGIFVAVMAVLRPGYRCYLKPYAAGLAVAALVASVLLAYPLHMLFFGPQTYHGLAERIRAYGADAASFFAFSRESLAGVLQPPRGLAQNASEENAFFGLPLVVLLTAVVWWCRRQAAVVALAVTGLVFAILSLGPRIRFRGRDTGVPSLWALLDELPILDSVVPTRWAMAMTPIIGLLLALAAERAARSARAQPALARPIRYVTVTMLATALLPIVPTPLPTERLEPTPEFVTSGAWRQYAGRDRSVVTLPLPASTYPDPLRWSAETGLEMQLARGYFLGPNRDPANPEDRSAIYSASWRPTAWLFESIRRTGEVPEIDAQRRAEAIDDLRHWRAGAVILAPGRHAGAFRQAMTELTGVQPTFTGGVWVWDVRPLID